MKKLFLCLLLASSFLLTSCKNSGEVQRRIVVHALGIDAHPAGYEVSYQVFSGGTPDGTPVDADESTVVTLLAQGRTLYETEESLRLQTGKEVFLGDAELIVISEELKDEDLAEFLQYFRKSDVYLGVNVVYCKGKASETIGSKLEQGSATAILLRSVVEEAVKNSRAQSSRIIEISNALERDNESVAMPILTLSKGEDRGEEFTLSDTTVGVFESQLITPDGAAGILDENGIMGVRLLRGDAKSMSIVVEVPEGIASVGLSDIKIKRRVAAKDGSPVVSVDISARYDIRSAPKDSNEEEVREAAQQQLIALCADAQKTLSQGDTMKIGKLLKKYCPAFSESNPNAAADTVFSVTVRLYKY